MKRVAALAIVLLIAVLLSSQYFMKQNSKNNTQPVQKVLKTESSYDNFPLSIANQRNKSYPGSTFKIEQTLTPGSNYQQYIASYTSDGLKIYGLLSIPNQTSPKGGFPAIIFNHGYIPPEEYKTTERYVAYFAGFASNGYVVFKPDYRGNGDSQGQPTGAYYSTGYTTDILNALSSVAKMKEVNPQKIGMWGHSMGGYLTLQALVIEPNKIKAAVIWGGVVGTPNDLLTKWHPNQTFHPSHRELASGRTTRQSLIQQYGTPSSNPNFWDAISAYSYLNDIKAPVQLDHGLSDEEVPVLFSQDLYNALKKDKKTTELYTYPGNDHNISQSFNLAMERSVDFFNQYLK